MDDRRFSIDRRGGDRRLGDDRRTPGMRSRRAGALGHGDVPPVQARCPCSGICALRDTRSCGGGACHGCGVAASGICARRSHCGDRGRAGKAQAGNCDYRTLAAAFIKRMDEDGGSYDSRFLEQIMREERRHRRYQDDIEMQRAAAAQNSVACSGDLHMPLPEISMSDVLDLFPGVDRDPSRFEIQLFIYMFQNHRFEIDISHVAGRFLLPQAAINRIMRGYFGATYPNLLSMIRNEHSKRYLGVARLRVNEAGELAGYRNPCNYSVSFKRLEGKSPREYRADRGVSAGRDQAGAG